VEEPAFPTSNPVKPPASNQQLQLIPQHKQNKHDNHQKTHIQQVPINYLQPRILLIEIREGRLSRRPSSFKSILYAKVIAHQDFTKSVQS
jgi:hypothetical protein